MKLPDPEGIGGPFAWLYSRVVARSPVLRDFYRDVAEEVSGVLGKGKILDVGTGPGSIPIMIGLRSRFVEVVGADISPAMVAIASGRARAEGIADRIRFRVGDAAALPFPDGSFDLVLSTLSLHHWSKPEQAAREMWRVLKDGGEAWIYDLRADTSREMEEEIRRKYGRFPAFLILVVIRAHSSISLTNAREALFNGAGRFREMETLDRGIFLHLRLRK